MSETTRFGDERAFQDTACQTVRQSLWHRQTYPMEGRRFSPYGTWAKIAAGGHEDLLQDFQRGSALYRQGLHDAVKLLGCHDLGQLARDALEEAGVGVTPTQSEDSWAEERAYSLSCVTPIVSDDYFDRTLHEMCETGPRSRFDTGKLLGLQITITDPVTVQYTAGSMSLSKAERSISTISVNSGNVYEVEVGVPFDHTTSYLEGVAAFGCSGIHPIAYTLTTLSSIFSSFTRFQALSSHCAFIRIPIRGPRIGTYRSWSGRLKFCCPDRTTS